MITEGQFVLTMNGERQTFGVGEWYHAPAGAEHAADFPDDSAEIEFWFDADRPA